MKTHDNHLDRLREPALRSSVITAAAALAVIFIVQFEAGSVAAAGVPVLCGIAGLVLRWTAMPVSLVVTLGYFLLFPIGFPFDFPQRDARNASHFRVEDLVLVAAVLVYLMAQFRIFSLTPPRGTSDVARSPETLLPNELLSFALCASLTVLGGQIIWYILDEFELHFGADSPIRLIPTVNRRMQGSLPSTQSFELSRFLILVLSMALAAGIARLIFWNLRLRSLSPLEARLVLLDTQWQGHRRELSRQETWRSFALGHDSSRRGDARRTFRWVVRGIVILNVLGFSIWILFFYLSIR